MQSGLHLSCSHREKSNFLETRSILGHTGVLGIWGERLFLFRYGNYFRAGGQKAHSFWDLGSPAQKKKN